MSASGAFEIRGVEPGCYRVTVLSATTGRKVYDGVHDLGRQGDALQIRLADKSPERPVHGGVSLGQLRPNPPKKAVRLLERAARLSAAGDAAGAAAELRKAIEVHPAFAEAHINLGAQLARLRQPAEALREFEQARLLGIEDAALWTNIAAARLELGESAAAQEAVERAFTRQATYPQAHFIAGQIVLRQRKTREAVEHFELARAVPASRLMLAQIFARTGRLADARLELEAYLASGHQAYRETATRMLREIPDSH